MVQVVTRSRRGRSSGRSSSRWIARWTELEPAFAGDSWIWTEHRVTARVRNRLLYPAHHIGVVVPAPAAFDVARHRQSHGLGIEQDRAEAERGRKRGQARRDPLAAHPDLFARQ